MSSEALALRPHHGMCLAYFVGLGYSGGFAAHTAWVLEELTPDHLIRLTVHADAVCAACPRNSGERCDNPELVEGYDRAVLRLCALAEGAVLPFGAFTARVQEKILAPGLRREICGDCQWNSVCSSHPSRWV